MGWDVWLRDTAGFLPASRIWRCLVAPPQGRPCTIEKTGSVCFPLHVVLNFYARREQVFETVTPDIAVRG